jgi:hypothetical protein
LIVEPDAVALPDRTSDRHLPPSIIVALLSLFGGVAVKFR